MSQNYWGILMYGIRDYRIKYKEGEVLGEVPVIKEYISKNNLDPDDPDDALWDCIDDSVFDNAADIVVDLPNGKHVNIEWEAIEGEGRIYGFSAGYPWQADMKNLEKRDIEDAMWQIFEPFVDMAKKDFVSEMEYISDYNGG